MYIPNQKSTDYLEYEIKKLEARVSALEDKMNKMDMIMEILNNKMEELGISFDQAMIDMMEDEYES